jgi:hypothetical protein
MNRLIQSVRRGWTSRYTVGVLATNGNGHLSVVEAELVRVKRQNAQLRAELAAVQGVAALIPVAYAEAITFAQFCAIGRPVTDEPGRGHAQSQPPPRDEAAYAVLRREQAFLTNRAREIRSATERAVERRAIRDWVPSPRTTETRWGVVAQAVNMIRADQLGVEDRYALLGVCARLAISEQPAATLSAPRGDRR